MFNRTFYDHIEQNTEDWHSLRLGIPTASGFKCIMSKGRGGRRSEQRKTYLYKLAAEYITGKADIVTSEYMQRGHDDESIAFKLYQERNDVAIDKVGFVLYEDADAEKVKLKAGYSPDGVVDMQGLIEIKSRLPHLQARQIMENKIPKDYEAQVQGGLFISGMEWLDFISYCPGMPLYVKRVYRDENYFIGLEQELYSFYWELQETIKKILNYQ